MPDSRSGTNARAQFPIRSPPEEEEDGPRQKPKKKVVVCVPSLSDVNGAGGVAPRWKLYIGELRKAGYVPEIWTVSCDDGSPKVMPRCVHPFYPKTLIDMPSPWMMARLWRSLSDGETKALVVTDLFNDVNLGLLALAAGVPLVYSVHTDGSKLPGGIPAMATLSQALTARLATELVTTSKSFARTLEERGVRDARGCRASWYKPLDASELLWGNPLLDITKERKELMTASKKGLLLVYVGRWSLEKRIDLLVSAVQELSEEVTLAIVGDAADDRVAADVEAWHDPPRIIVRRGMRKRGPELVATYRAADFIVSASSFETFGNVAQEAATCGTPAILQRGPGFVDQIPSEPSDRGTLMDFYAPDAADQLKRAISRTRHLTKRPDLVKAAVKTHLHGDTIADVLDRATTTTSKLRGPLQRALAFVASFVVAACIRCFVAGYSGLLRLALVLSLLFPRLRACLRPPSRRLHWAGALRFSRIFRTDLVAWRRPFHSNPHLVGSNDIPVIVNDENLTSSRATTATTPPGPPTKGLATTPTKYNQLRQRSLGLK